MSEQHIVRVSKQWASTSMLVEENLLDRENSYIPCEQRRFWSSWPRGVAQGTMESPLSEPCWQDPRSTGVVLQWEAAVSVEQTDPATESHTSWGASLPTEGAVTPMRLSTPQQGFPFSTYVLASSEMLWEVTLQMMSKLLLEKILATIKSRCLKTVDLLEFFLT